MSVEYILGIVGVILAAIMTAFGIGHSKGKAKAEQAASERETQTNIESMKAATQRQTETAKGASDVQKLFPVCPAALLMTSCAKTGSTRVEVVDTACNWVKPIMVTEADIMMMDERTKRAIPPITRHGKPTASREQNEWLFDLQHPLRRLYWRAHYDMDRHLVLVASGEQAP